MTVKKGCGIQSFFFWRLIETMEQQTYQEPWDWTESDHRLKKGLDNVRLLAGNSHPVLAQRIAAELGIPLTDGGVSYFSNTETRIKPDSAAAGTFRGKSVFIIQTGSADLSEDSVREFGQTRSVNDHIQEVLLLMDACRRGGCNDITLIIPCYPYARQDKKDSSRAPISAAVVAKQFESQGVDRIICLDLHNSCIQGLFTDPFRRCSDNLYPTRVLREWLMNNVFHATTVGDPSYTEKFVVIAPDAGAAQKVEKVAGYLGLDFLTMNKARDYNTKNKVKKIQLQCAPEMLEGKTPQDFLAGRTAIIVDDMADTCGTVVAAIEKLMAYGVEGCIVAVTHGVLSGPALQRIEECDGLKMVVVSDSLPQERNVEKCSKIRVYSVAKFLAELVRRTVVKKSFSTLIAE